MPGVLSGFDAAAIQAHIISNNSTHGSAIEASSARLIRLLRGAYPGIGLILEEQCILVRYLDAKIDNPAYEVPAVSEHLQIVDTIRVIHRIDSKGSLSSENKQKIWRQMRSIARTYEGDRWTPYDAQWSQNSIYNPDTGMSDQVSASPAETMNLVCKAILDTHRYVASDGRDDEYNLDCRVESFYSRLFELQTQEEAGHFEFCAAGRQHEMLYILNKAYLSSLDPGALPIELIESTLTFLADSLSLYVETQLNGLDPIARSKVVLDSMRWQAGLIELAESPLITWLKESHPGVDWRLHCVHYLGKRCHDFGLNPKDCKLEDVINALPDKALPASRSMLEPVMAEIFRAPFFSPQEQRARGGVASARDVWNALVLAANSALRTIRGRLSADNLAGLANILYDFYKTLEVMESLNHYKDLMIFVGADEGDFNKARDIAESGLLGYYTGFNLESRLSTGVEISLQRYMACQRAFSERAQVDFIENSFAHLCAGLDFNSWWDRIQSLKPADADKHPLELSDEVLERWYTEHVVDDREVGISYMDISPYQINRILLHALLVSPSQWTLNYSKSLEAITEWLLQPQRAGQGILNALKYSYKGKILSNLLLLSLLSRPSYEDKAVKRHIQELFGQKIYLFNISLLLRIIRRLTTADTTRFLIAIQRHLVDLIQDGDELKDLLSLDECELSLVHKTQIFTAVESHLVDLIKNPAQLRALLSLPESHLIAEHKTKILMAGTHVIQDGAQLRELLSTRSWLLSLAHKTQILTAVEARLVHLIQDGVQLTGLLSLNGLQLSTAHKTQILTAIEARLVDLIQDGVLLRQLLSFPESQLSTAQKTQILTAVESKLSYLIKDGSQLSDLLSSPEWALSQVHKIHILTALKGHLVNFIQDGVQLRCLLSLSESQLSSEDKTQILIAVEGQLVALIQDGVQLRDLLSLPESNLSMAQKNQILSAVGSKLIYLIKDGAQLRALLSLRESQLSLAQKTQILTAVKGRLVYLIQNAAQLKDLLSLPDSELSLADKTQLLTVVEAQLVDLIQDGVQLRDLLSFDESELSASLKAQVCNSLVGWLADLIKDGSQLKGLLSLPESQLSAVLKTQILESIEGQLAYLIKDRIQLLDLLSLPELQLSAVHKTRILTAVKARWLDWIQHRVQLMEFLSLSEWRLSAVHKTQILTALQVRLVDLIQNGIHLRDLLSLPDCELSPVHKTQIWDSIEGRLPDLIKNGIQLLTLLSLPVSRLNEEHRAQIMRALERRLGHLIEDGLQLLDLLSLPLSQLSAAHKTQILTELEPRLVDLIKNKGWLIGFLSIPTSALSAQHKSHILTAIGERLVELIPNQFQLRGLLSLPESILSAAHKTHILMAIKDFLDVDGLEEEAVPRASATVSSTASAVRARFFASVAVSLAPEPPPLGNTQGH